MRSLVPHSEQTPPAITFADDALARQSGVIGTLNLARLDVTVASSGGEGLEILRKNPIIGLVLLDLTMPEMTAVGQELAFPVSSRLSASGSRIVKFPQ
jgi:CheY-like chemotaxis protein